jgi:hypothetical protein
MSLPHPLNRIVERETFAEIVALLRPEELIVAALRLEGLTDGQIGRLLGLTRAAVSYRMQQAQERIAAEAPELAPAVAGRRLPCSRPASAETAPLEQGWLGEGPFGNNGASLSVQDLARRCQVTRQAVLHWVDEGHFPHAYRANDGRGSLILSEDDLDRLGAK